MCVAFAQLSSLKYICSRLIIVWRCSCACVNTNCAWSLCSSYFALCYNGHFLACLGKEMCFLDPKAGFCSDQQTIYYYDRHSRSCKNFSFTGCGANDNHFLTQQECVDKCEKPLEEARGKYRCEICSYLEAWIFTLCPISALSALTLISKLSCMLHWVWCLKMLNEARKI